MSRGPWKNNRSKAEADKLVELARGLKKQGKTREEVSDELGVSLDWLRYRLKWRAPNTRPFQSNRHYATPPVPKDTRNFTQRFFGDPLPGRSALDKKKAAGELA